jgi:hypothetical protein
MTLGGGSRPRPPTPLAVLRPTEGTAGLPRVFLADEELRVHEHAGRIYVVTVHHRVTRALLPRALAGIWSAPSWRQPWGLVTSNPLHRVVITSMGIAYRMVSRFVVTAHETLDDAVRTERALVEQALAERRPF